MQKAEVDKFLLSWVYRVSSRMARATQKSPVSKNQTLQTTTIFAKQETQFYFVRFPDFKL